MASELPDGHRVTCFATTRNLRLPCTLDLALLPIECQRRLELTWLNPSRDNLRHSALLLPMLGRSLPTTIRSSATETRGNHEE